MATAQPNVQLIKTLFEAEVHLGHKRNRLHPKARKFVYRIEEGTSIIDLTITASQFEAAKAFIKKARGEGKFMLVVATKKVASVFIADLCKTHNISYVTTKWLPGLLTNYPTLIKNVQKMNEMRKAKEEDGWHALVKHERTKLQKRLSRLEKLYAGLAGLTKKPDFLLVVDIRREHNAVDEAAKTATPVVAIADTNTNPNEVEYPIVANDDSPKAVEYIAKEMINAYTTAEKEMNEDKEKKA